MKYAALLLIGLLLTSCSESFIEERQRIANSTDDPVLKIWGPYMVCKKDTDCVIEKGICGVPVGINKKGRRKFIEHAAKVNMTIKCSQPLYEDLIYDVSMLSVSCETGFCRMSGLAEQLVGTPYEINVPPNSHRP